MRELKELKERECCKGGSALWGELLVKRREVEALQKSLKEFEVGKAELEAEMEAERERRRVVHEGTQSGAAEVTAAGTQTAKRTYANVVAQTEDTGKMMDKPAGTTPVGDRPVRAFVVHGVACSGAGGGAGHLPQWWCI